MPLLGKRKRRQEQVTEVRFMEEITKEEEVFRSQRARGLVGVRPPPNFKTIETYPLNEPWAMARIIQNPDTGETIYWVDEIPLTPEEEKVYRRIMDVLYYELKPPPAGVDPFEYFRRQAREIIRRFRIRLGRTPTISWAKILYYVERDVIGFGPIDPLMRDPFIEDISCNGVDVPIFVWHRKYEYIPTNIMFPKEREEDLDALVVKLAHMAGKHVSVAFPVVDAILPGGHRLAATYKREVSTKGSTFTIRKFREDPITIVDMVKWGTVSAEVAAYLWIIMEHKMTGMIIGVTGAGKTSTLNALATMLRPTTKVVTIEDTPELKLPLKNWVQLVSRPGYGFGGEKIGEITLFDLVKISLRYRPDIIIVGEVRGEEAYVLFQAIATGHGGLTTMHAEHIDAAVKRLTSPPMNVPPSYIPLMNFALVIRRVQLFRPDGTYYITRRVVNVWEVKDYGEYIEVVRWDPARDKHQLFPERSKLLREIAEQRGMPVEWAYEEIAKRKVILQWMAVKGLRRYTQVAEVVYKYYAKPRETYKEAVEELQRLGYHPTEASEAE